MGKGLVSMDASRLYIPASMIENSCLEWSEES